jgi:hypothetical protein
MSGRNCSAVANAEKEVFVYWLLNIETALQKKRSIFKRP